MSHEFPPSEDPAIRDVPADLGPAGFFTRMGAYFIDTVAISLFALVPVIGIAFLAGLAYKTLFVQQGGQTPGKMAGGIKVVTTSGEPVGLGRALGRALAEWLNVLTCAAGYVPALFGEKRALHDYVAGTRVVVAERLTTGRKILFVALSGFCGLLWIGFIVVSAAAGGAFGKFGELAKKAGEGATKGSLGSLRSASILYYSDTEGNYPAGLDALIGRRGLTSMPRTDVGVHAKSVEWNAYGDEVCEPVASDPKDGKLGGARLRDTGGWGYVADPKSNCWGMVFVDCTHADSKGKPWFEY